jgi:hypothetical protein
MTRTIAKSAIVLGFTGAMWLGGTGPSTAGGIFAKGATLTEGAPAYQEVRYRRGYRSYARARRGVGYGDPARTHRPMDSWDPYAKRWD